MKPLMLHFKSRGFIVFKCHCQLSMAILYSTHIAGSRTAMLELAFTVQRLSKWLS